MKESVTVYDINVLISLFKQSYLSNSPSSGKEKMLNILYALNAKGAVNLKRVKDLSESPIQKSKEILLSKQTRLR